jgi:hypothetical protein
VATAEQTKAPANAKIEKVFKRRVMASDPKVKHAIVKLMSGMRQYATSQSPIDPRTTYFETLIAIEMKSTIIWLNAKNLVECPDQ